MNRVLAACGQSACLLAIGSVCFASSSFAPDVPEPGSAEKIREYTTGDSYLPASVSYVPDSQSVPSPTEVLGHLVGAPGELSRTATVHDYMRRLDAASTRVQVRTIGTSEEGREMIVVLVSDQRTLEHLEQHTQTTHRLADPRTTSREQMEEFAANGKAIYYLLGGLHSPETGSPEMLMELAYRLAVSERPEIRAIRDNLIVAITPVCEPDGRDRVVDWYYRHLRGRELPFEELAKFRSPPYWGHYAFHDNNRDGMQLTLALTRAVHGVFYDLRPQVVHDLHESLPLLYISTGHGPYNDAIDPVTINEWTQFAHHEAANLQAQGLPGVWVWGFWDGWWPGYLFSVANNHNAIGRFYETFGNSMAETFERDTSERKFVGKSVTEEQWYRPWPPDKKVQWSLRNNTNYMQAGVLEALHYAALHRQELLRNHWIKAERAMAKGRDKAPHAWIFARQQNDAGRLAYLVNLLRQHRIEVHELETTFKSGEKTYAAGSYVVRLDQPYRNTIVSFLEEQKFPADEPNAPYDDIAWTWPLLMGVDGARIDDAGILKAKMRRLEADVGPDGEVSGQGAVALLRDSGQTSLLAARVALGSARVEAARAEFSSGGTTYPAGSWIVQEFDDAMLADVSARFGLDFVRARRAPDVERHVVDLPRLGVLHTWTATQDCGWARYTLDQEGVPYTLVTQDDLRRGQLRARFDVILFPNTSGEFKRIVHGIDPEFGPLAYTKTAEYASHGVPNGSEDITGGMGFAGAMHVEEFLHAGGVLLAVGNAGRLPVDGGMVRRVDTVNNAPSTPGSEVRAKVVQRQHPLAYGYDEMTSVFRGNMALFDVAKEDRALVVVQFGTKQVPEDESTEKKSDGDKKSADEKKKLVLSGFVKEPDKIDGKPAVLDVPVGQGRVVLYAFNPLHRYLNHSDFRFVYNGILNWNDFGAPAEPTPPEAITRRR
jgi:hypothetical protein